MSYNPAFVADDLPLAGSGNDNQSSNGIKLTSFKALAPSVAIDVERDADKSRGGQQKRKRAPKQSDESSQKLAAPAPPGDPSSAKQSNKLFSKACVSTSSSLSLIGDNPASLTPSASSYSTTTSASSTITSATSSSLCAAVECRDMRYDVGRGRNQKTILYNINVTVPEGSIYGLLGPSGCGKTTMLRCVVGRIKPKEGYVRVFGYKPNDSGSQIPGPAIGYMPQVSN